MAQVEIPTRLQAKTNGEARMSIEARNVRALLSELDSRYPGIADELKATTTVAIDGEVIGTSLSDAVLERLEDDTEVFFVPAIAGG